MLAWLHGGALPALLLALQLSVLVSVQPRVAAGGARSGAGATGVAVTVHNRSGCCCQNIYPRTAAQLVAGGPDGVPGCIASCRSDPLCHAAIIIGSTRADVAEQCQADPTAVNVTGRACCIHKAHMDSLGAVDADLTTIDMGTSPGGASCPCPNHGWDKPCDAPVPASCMMYPGPGPGASGVFGPCSAAVPPPPPPPPYELHRPVYHLTPIQGHNNDPNGMFYDVAHGRYHVFVQWSPLDPGDHFPAAWYHMSAPDLAGPWDRYPLQFANLSHPEVAGCSGGAAIAPDGTPTLVICGGATAIPANRSDPLLTHWVQTSGDITERNVPAAYFPPDVPGKWDCSIYREPTGRYRITFGSCTMLHGRVRPNQLNGYCDGKTQDGLPQVLSYVSTDLKRWQYLGEQWKGDNGSAAGRRWGPRVECPYQFNIRSHTLLKISAVAFGTDVLFVGQALGNGSRFQGDASGPPDGIRIDFGDVYAAAILHRPAAGRHVYFGWAKCGYKIDKATAGFDSALTLPRDMDVDQSGVPTWEVSAEMAKLRTGPPAVQTDVVLQPNGGAMLLTLPPGAVGDAVEIRVNFTRRDNDATLSVETRRTADGRERATVTFAVDGAAATVAGPVVETVSRDPASQGTQIRSATGSLPLGADGKVSLRVFVDKSVVESHLNARRSVSTRFYPLDLTPGTGAFGLRVVNSGARGPVKIDSVEVWGMRSIY